MPDIDIAHLTDRFMRRVHSALNESADEFDTHKVGPIGGMMLLTLAEIEPAKIHDLVARSARDKSQITKLVKIMEAKGLMEREADPNDARVWLLRLTPLGQETVLDLQKAIASALDKILSPLSTNEKEDLRSLLRRI